VQFAGILLGATGRLRKMNYVDGRGTSKSEVVKDALRLLLETRKELKTVSAVELYKSGEISLGKAAEIAGVTVIEFKEMLAS